MTTKRRSTDTSSQIFDRSDRIFILDQAYCYKTREGEIRNGFATLSAALFDLNNFIDVVLIESELKSNYFALAA